MLGAPTTETPILDPPLFREFPFNIGLRMLAPGDIRPTPSSANAIELFARMGDPLADDLVAAFRRLPAGAGAGPVRNGTRARHRRRRQPDAGVGDVLRSRGRQTVLGEPEEARLCGTGDGTYRHGCRLHLDVDVLADGRLPGRASRQDPERVQTGDLEAMARAVSPRR